MKIHRNLSISLVAGSMLVVLLPLLALLQYRWLGQVSEAEREQMTTSVQSSAHRIADDFDQEVTRAFLLFLFPSDQLSDESTFPDRYRHWTESARDVRLVKSVFVAAAEASDRLFLKQFNAGDNRFNAIEWPTELAPKRTELEQRMAVIRTAFEQSPPTMPPPPNLSSLMDSDLPGIISPITRFDESLGADGVPVITGFLIIQFDAKFIREEFLPALARLNSDTSTYDLAVISRNDPKQVIWQTVSSDYSKPDTSQVMFGLRGSQIRDYFRSQSSGNRNTNRRGGWFAPRSEDSRIWELRIRHRAGSLGAAVANIRRRNLIISSGILVVLMASIVLLMLAVNRARRLAQQQMDFVAAISHELRTPIAVIDSAGYNLTKGVIKDQEQISRYGSLIRKETRRLHEMIEQILEFAGVHTNKARYALQVVDVNQVIQEVITATQPLLEEGQFTLKTDIAPKLPFVLADSQALSRALQNLLNNAMKYSGASKTIELTASPVTTAKGKDLAISVSDSGIGIPVREQSHIFEPFYRGAEAKAAQIHGNGLGLSLVKSIVAAHQGRITLVSSEGRGSRFTISIPAVPEEVAQTAGVEAPA